MKKTLVSLALCGLLAASAAPATAAKSGLKTLGTDPSGDGIPGLDVTYLKVGRNADALEIRIGLEMLPQLGGYPDLPGIEWIFDVNGKTFLAEAVKTADGSDYYLFELSDDGSFRQLTSPTGTYEAADGYASILVPLKDIGAKKGTVVKGADGQEHGDVDAHVHVGTVTHYPDGMETDKTFVVP
ncbi:MAG TPA: hypothetical protein VG318_00780 [Actinomycetota bacterium]|nr:hypothetical protein [Actinomycetota bacterium]